MQAERLQILNEITETLQDHLNKDGYLNLYFICTHNSRRSQFSQAWAHALAQERQLPIYSFSAGVEVTACNHRTIESLKRAGFEVAVLMDELPNPNYEIRWKTGMPITLFSKLFDDVSKPKTDFFALMTCSDADENCPYIPGTIKRIPLKYTDPKFADDTPEEASAYDTCSHTIRTEIQYIFDQLTHISK